jgi:hypothetical protein
MARNIEKIAAGLGAKVIARVPHTGGGASGAARPARIAADLRARLRPGPTDPAVPAAAGPRPVPEGAPMTDAASMGPRR